MDEKLVERLRARANQGGYIPDITLMFQAATALTLAQARIKLLERFLHHEQGIMADLRSAHAGRGQGVSSAMLEDDRDQYSTLQRLFDDTRQALKEAPDV